ncbi:hypothetical protein SDC9_208262 [bioreactor metagenome]|uniref:Uncharacterized protein n=1 Tax=bioreactor metagenome TaxID=1076179 RepID=A0A645JJL7_9ZZZZ
MALINQVLRGIGAGVSPAAGAEWFEVVLFRPIFFAKRIYFRFGLFKCKERRDAGMALFGHKRGNRAGHAAP